MQKTDVIIIGGGAAGLMCAIEAGKRGRSVIVIEHEEKIGKKILISGGGRCNFTNRFSSDKNFFSQNPHFCKSALSRYTPGDFISLVEKYKIAYHEKKLGQLFCDGSSRQIVAMLESECKELNVRFILNCKIHQIKKDLSFELETSNGEFASESLVVASGGISIPKMGATDFGYKIAKQFGITLTEVRPGLVPFTFDEDDKKTFGVLSGISIDSIVTHDSISFRENILFTHRGLSGPAILQISSYWKGGDAIKINLLPGKNFIEILNDNFQNRNIIMNFISTFLPGRFTGIYFKELDTSKTINQFSKKDLKDVAEKIHKWKMFPSGTEGFEKAEVTTGGINTDALSSKTMESKKVKGLYFIGEVVDVTGWLGGHNFQWAWASGFAAGQYV